MPFIRIKFVLVVWHIFHQLCATKQDSTASGLSFSQQIEVLPFDLNDSNGIAKVYLEEQFCTVQLQFSTFDQHELTIAHSIQYESID